MDCRLEYVVWVIDSVLICYNVIGISFVWY